MSNSLSVREGPRNNLELIHVIALDYRAKIVARADAMIKLEDKIKIALEAETAMKDLKVFADLLAKVKVTGIIDAKLQAEIAGHLYVILKAIIKICAHLIAKLDINVALELIAKLELAVKLVIDNLQVCVAGVIDICVKLLTDDELKALVNVHLNILAKLFVKIRLSLGVKVLGISL
ncbi:unnamed protein product [Rhizoctonia solani]|uniref:Uncharacterized protein n=1 Tax=Rhizoctonia solani TaxID=456999 RepID=A0A8H3G5A0_9AGAM|nr:unnamed protein product [Rhizoctonia solani]